MRQSLFVTICLVVFLAFQISPCFGEKHHPPSGAGPPAAAPSHKILFLNTYQIGLPIPDDIERGFLAGLEKRNVSVKNLFIEHLDLARIYGAGYRKSIADLLRERLPASAMGIVIAEGAPAVTFFKKELQGLLPDVPMLTLIAPHVQSLVGPSDRVLNIPWQADNAGTLKLALRLFPATRNVVVVTGARDRILPYLQYAKKAFAPWKHKLRFEYTDKMTYEQMMHHIANLPKNSIIIYAPYFTDTTHRSFVPADVVAKICRSADAPVFSTQEYFLGSGIVGGSLLKTEQMGEKVADITVQYLKGHLKLDRPLTSFSTPPKLMLDWNALVRWKVASSSLPKGCTIINKPVSLWENNKKTVAAAIVAFLLLGTLSCTLWLVNRRLKSLTLAVGESEAYYHSIFTNSLIGITVTDKDFVFTDVNDAFCGMLGYSREELIGKMTISDISSPDDTIKSMDMINRLVHHEIDHYTIEKRYITKTGEDIPVLVYVKGHYGPDGQYEGTTASNLDITERNRTEALLMENEEKYRTLFNNSEVAMFRSRIDGSEILEVNQKFLDLVGKPREEVVGEPSSLFWEDPEERKEMVRRLMADGKVSEFESRLVNAQKGVRDCITSLRFYRGPGLLEGSIIDITEQKQAETEKAKMQAQLLQAQKMESVGQLAGGVAHDFNNMLGVILGHTDLAMDAIDRDYPIYKDLLEIKGAAERSASIVRQLLAFARKQVVIPKVIDLNVAVEGMMKMLRRLIGEDIDLIWKPGQDLWKVKIDPSQVDQLLANLCVNARDAISRVGSIIVETENRGVDDDFVSDTLHAASGAYVVLKVHDSGSGIPKELQPHIFEPFFTTKGVGKGTGLGLSTVYGIVQQNNGFIHVESEDKQGTTFMVFLPRDSSQPPETDGKKSASPVEGGHETILLVEDEPAIMKMTSSMLGRLGYRVMPASRPNAAIGMAKEHRGHIDLLMTDIIMPEMNGREMADEILKLHSETKCLFMSGYTADTIGQQVLLEKGIFFIQKPFLRADLAEKIREVLRAG